MSDPLTPYGNKPMVTPIVNSVNYHYKSFEVLRQITDGEIDGYTYHRDDNPTVRAVEKKIAAMENAEDCIICTSGMAACTLVYLTWLSAGDDSHKVACKQMHDGFGGVLAFDVGERREDAMRFIGGLKEIYHAVSLGATESLICIPYLTTMLYMPPERRLGFGVKENTVRLSAGIEREEVLIEDIEQALEQI